VARDRVRRLTVRRRSVRTGRNMRAHVSASWLSSLVHGLTSPGPDGHMLPRDDARHPVAPQIPTKWPRPLNLTLPRRDGERKRLADALNRDFPNIDTVKRCHWFRPTAKLTVTGRLPRILPNRPDHSLRYAAVRLPRALRVSGRRDGGTRLVRPPGRAGPRGCG
jgi:hypothetical protein